MAFFPCGKNKHVEIDFVHLKQHDELQDARLTHDLITCVSCFTEFTPSHSCGRARQPDVYGWTTTTTRENADCAVFIFCSWAADYCDNCVFDCRRLTTINDNKRLFVFSWEYRSVHILLHMFSVFCTVNIELRLDIRNRIAVSVRKIAIWFVSQIVQPSFMFTNSSIHLKRWAAHRVGSFITRGLLRLEELWSWSISKMSWIFFSGWSFISEYLMFLLLQFPSVT